MKLWQAILVIPASTAECERGFWRQNKIKSDDRNNLNLETLDAHMMLSLNKVEHKSIAWFQILEIWEKEQGKNRKGH